jgi:hypothetical protein
MSIGNPSFNLTPEQYTAAIDSFGLSLGSEYKSQIERQHPLFSLITMGKTMKDGNSGGNWNRQDLSVSGSGKEWFVTHPLAYDQVAQINASSIGRSPSTLPTGWPTLINPTGLTRARFQAAYFEFAIGFSVADKKLLAHRSPNVLEAKKTLALGAFTRAMADQINGSGPDSEEALMGIGYILSTSNTVGGISQLTNSWWQPNIDTGSGALTYQTINKYQTKAGYQTKPDGTSAKPDCIMLASAGTNDLYLAFQNSILGTQNITDDAFKERFGYECLRFGSARVFADPRATEQTVRGFCSDAFFFTGSEKPELSEPRPLPGTMDDHVVVSGWGCLSVDFLKGHYQYTGNTI